MARAKARRGRKNAKFAEQRAAEYAELRARLENFEGDAGETALAEIFAQWDGYSERNAMLIAMQAPHATDVSGFAQWKTRGRAVRKGETGIRILAPAGRRDATEGDEEHEAQPERRFFRLVSVFDVSQTEPLADAEARWAAQAAERAAEAA